jgi:hypothetical protein
MSAPKQRPVITGETTLAELAEILRTHEATRFDAGIIGRASSPDRWHAEIESSLGERRPTLADAMAEALLTYRIDNADELDLTPDEAAS